jgi:hypothetical protein
MFWVGLVLNYAYSSHLQEDADNSYTSREGSGATEGEL